MEFTIEHAPEPWKNVGILRAYLDEELSISGSEAEEICENFVFYWLPSGVTAELIAESMEMDFMRWLYKFQTFLNKEDWVRLQKMMYTR
jgi:hypothetical protein